MVVDIYSNLCRCTIEKISQEQEFMHACSVWVLERVKELYAFTLLQIFFIRSICFHRPKITDENCGEI